MLLFCFAVVFQFLLHILYEAICVTPFMNKTSIYKYIKIGFRSVMQCTAAAT